MYEELYAPLPDIGKYLDRLGLTSPIDPNLDGLNTLVRAQLTHIPFDDMDVWGLGRCPSLATADLFEKIVLRKRGGYCFELNSLFCRLLKDLGFEAYVVLARLLEGRDFVPPPSHCGVVCIIDGIKYFCDVGYGGQVPYGAVKMDEAEHIGYRVLRDEYECTLQRLENGTFNTIMKFNDIPTLPVELIPSNYYISQIPDSRFRNVLLVNQRISETGAYSINDNCLKIHIPGNKSTISIRDTAHLKELLLEYFGMEADAVDIPERSFSE